MEKDTRTMTAITLKGACNGPESVAKSCKSWIEWLDAMVEARNKKALEAVVMGCAEFRLKQSTIAITAKIKSERIKAKRDASIARMYLQVARAYLDCVR